MEHSVNLLISDEEKERVWPWLDEVRERHVETTQDMTPDEQIAYYQVELKRLRQEQNYHPPIGKTSKVYLEKIAYSANRIAY